MIIFSINVLSSILKGSALERFILNKLKVINYDFGRSIFLGGHGRLLGHYYYHYDYVRCHDHVGGHDQDGGHDHEGGHDHCEGKNLDHA